MTIRARLLWMCLVVALLPAVPLTLLVQSLLDKSFNVGLSSTVEKALQSGMSVSRTYYDELRRNFRRDVWSAVNEAGDDRSTARTVFLSSGGPLDGALAATATSAAPDSTLPPGLGAFAGNDTLRAVLGAGAAVNGPTATVAVPRVDLYETENRSVQMAVWNGVLFFRRTDPEFVASADRLLQGRQIFAELRLKRRGLTRSFFYPFVVIYGLSVLVALALALFMAERLSEPIRRLVFGTSAVAGGDWTYRLDVKAGGETGQLVGAFNTMVAQLDDQQRRIVDMEKMASWREVARHLAHEIKNPLMPIRLTIEEVRDQYKGDDTRYREFLSESVRVVGDELAHLQQLVKSFSEFAKLPELHVSRGSLESLVRDVSRLYPQVESRVDTPASVPEVVFDADLVRRVVVNLYDNVVSVAGGGAAVDVALRRDGDAMVMTFADNGPGIPEENLARVFEPYFTTRADGSGLGLAMLKNIVLMHGGTVAVASTAGEGTTFTIRLPLEGPPDAAPRPRRAVD